MRRNRLDRRGWPGLLTALVLLTGCSVSPDRGTVQKEWSLTLRELGINPIYPPRENVIVGDVYLRRGDPADEKMLEKRRFVPHDLWVASVPLAKETSAFYSSRPSYPSTPNVEGGALALLSQIKVVCASHLKNDVVRRATESRTTAR